MNQKSLNTADVRKQNRMSIFNYVYDNENCTKQKIATALNLSLPTVVNNITSLIEDNLLCFGGIGTSSGGRKPQFVIISRLAKISIGISVTKMHVRFIALNLIGEKIGYKKINKKECSPSELGIILSEELETFIDEYNINRSKILGVGIALPGIISKNAEIIELAPSLKYKNVEMKILTKYIPYTASVINDASAGGFAECWKRSDNENLIYISVDRGIGGAILIKNDLYEGTNSHSAEFGHMCIAQNGKECSCGRNGCLEAYCSISRLSEDLDCSIEEFFDAISAGTEKNIKILNEYLDNLAIGISNIYTIFDAKIVIGGTLAQFSELYFEKLIANVNRNNIFKETNNHIEISKYGSRASCMGCALAYIQKFKKNI